MVVVAVILAQMLPILLWKVCDAGHLEAKVIGSNALTEKRWGMSRQTRKRQYLKARGKLSKDRIFRFFGKNLKKQFCNFFANYC